MKPISKPGEHGRLYLYRVVYRDESGYPEFSYRTWAYSLEHVRLKFEDEDDSEGWELVSAQRVPKRGILAHAPVHVF